MSGDSVWRGVRQVAEQAGAQAVADARGVLAARAEAAFPEIAVTIAPDGIVLQAPGLVARAFGSRRRAPDPRLAGLTLGEFA